MEVLALTVIVIGCKVYGSTLGDFAIDLLFRIMKFFFWDESLEHDLSSISFFMDEPLIS